MNSRANYTRREMELRAADYYASIRKPESQWQSVADLAPQFAEFEHYICSSAYDKACRLLAQFDLDYLFRWGYYDLVAHMREKLRGNLTDRNLQSYNYGGLGDIYRVFGRLEAAISSYRQALTIARDVGNQKLESLWLGNLGSAYRVLGQVKLATNFYEQALNISRNLNDYKNEGIYLSRLGHTYHITGQVAKAILLYEMALTIARRIGNRWREGTELGNLGRMYQVLDQVDSAIRFYQQALTIAREINNRREEAVWLGHLAAAYLASGQISSAAQFRKQALDIARDIQDHPEESYQLFGLGSIQLVMGDHTKAIEYFMQATRLESSRNRHLVFLKLGIVYLYQHNHVVATNAFGSAITDCGSFLDKTVNLYAPRYTLATAFVGQVVCDPRWADATHRADLLVPALAEYCRALDITSAPGIVRDAFRDLELIRAAGIKGLEPVFELLEGALNE